MKLLAFVIAAAVAATPSPLAAQMAMGGGYELIDAVKKSDGDKLIKVLATNPPGIVNTKDGDGNTGLLIAINRGDETWAGFLLNKGADPNIAGKGGETPLIAATRMGLDQVVGWLIGLGAKVDGGNRMGETPLIIAVQQRETSIVRRLLDAGANPDRTDAAAGFSARDYATRDPRAREILKMIEGKKPKTAAASK